MTVTYREKASRTTGTGHGGLQARVQTMPHELLSGGDEIARGMARELGDWVGDTLVSPETAEAAKIAAPEQRKDDIRLARDTLRRLAEAQLATISACSPLRWAGTPRRVDASGAAGAILMGWVLGEVFNSRGRCRGAGSRSSISGWGPVMLVGALFD